MRDDRGSRRLARPSTAPQPPEHATKRRPQRVARHPNVRHQPPLVHAARQPANHAHAHKKPYLSLRRGPSPEPPPREHAPHPHHQPDFKRTPTQPPSYAVGGRPVPRSPAGPRRRHRSTNGKLSSRPPSLLAQLTGRARVLIQNPRRHPHPRTHRGALSATPTPATQQPAPVNCHCCEGHQVNWRRPGEPNARICSSRTGIGPEKQIAGTGQRFFPWCTGDGRVAFSLGRPVLAVAEDVQSFDELEHVSPARARGARALERRHGRHREHEVGRRGHHRRTELLCKSHEVVDPQTKIVDYHLAHDSPRRRTREQDNTAQGVPA